MNNQQLIDYIDTTDNIMRAIVAVDVLLRNGNVVSAYRQGVQIIDRLDDPQRKTMSRVLIKIRKGEQIDALNDIKSLQDLLKNEKKNRLIQFLNSKDDAFFEPKKL